VFASPSAVAIAIVVFLLPLVLDPGGLYPFGPAKWMLLTVGILAATALLVGEPEARADRSGVFAWGAFLAWAAFSAFFALDPLHSWIGTPERRMGVVALVIFALAFLLGQIVDNHRTLVLRSASLSLGLVGVYALADLNGFSLVMLASTSMRVGGSLGSPAYLGAVCVLLVPVAAGVALESEESKPWRVVGGLAACLGLLALVASQSRAALIGLVAGLVFVTLSTPRRRLVTAIGAIVLFGALMLTPPGQRLLDIAESPEARSRLDEWRVGTRALAAHLVVGSGLEGYRIAFPSVVDAEYEQRYGREVAPDRAHNGALDMAIAMGIPGALFYLVAAGWLVVRSLRAVRLGNPALIGIAAGVVAYIAQQQFLFPLAEVDPIFWVLAGLLVAATSRGEATIPVPRSRLVAGVLVVLLLAGAGLGALELVADRRAATSYTLLASGDHTGAVDEADDAAAIRPDSIRYWFVASDVATRPGDPDALREGLTRIDRALAVSPRDAILMTTRARLLLDLAQATNSAVDLEVALTALSELTIGDPHNASHRLLTGVALVLVDDLDAAESEWKLAQSLAPNSPVPSMNLARLYLSQDRIEEARASYLHALAIDASAPGLPELARLIDDAESGGPVP
jgi:O-antigen ligase